MPSTKPKIVIRTTDEVIQKLSYIAGKNNRSVSNQGETIIKDFIAQYEENQGKIQIINMHDNNGIINM